MPDRSGSDRFAVPIDAIRTHRRARDERPVKGPVDYHASTDREGRVRAIFRAATVDRLTTSYLATRASGRWVARGWVIERMYGEEAVSERITPVQARLILEEWGVELDEHDSRAA